MISRLTFQARGILMRLLLTLLSTLVSATNLPSGPEEAGGEVRRVMADTIPVCLIVDGEIREIVAEYDPVSRDTTVAGIPLSDAHPATTPPYLGGAEWYARDEMVLFERRRYLRYGLPRVVRPAALTRVGEFRGIPLFAESRRHAMRYVYALVNPGCEFQPYWYAATVGEVRGR